MYADCLLKTTSTKHSKYVVNQKLEHIDDISFRDLFDRIRVPIKCMNLRRSARILARTSPSIKRFEQDGTMGTVLSGTAGVPFKHYKKQRNRVNNLKKRVK
jgi:hypothetical protein